jgi:hypothetical protein
MHRHPHVFNRWTNRLGKQLDGGGAIIRQPISDWQARRMTAARIVGRQASRGFCGASKPV